MDEMGFGVSKPALASGNYLDEYALLCMRKHADGSYKILKVKGSL